MPSPLKGRLGMDGPLRGNFAKSVAMLAGGTAGAQLIFVLTLPILTRLYSPDDFALLGVFTAIFSLLAITACLGFDNAIPIPESDAEAMRLLLASLALCAGVTGLSAIALVGWREQISELLRAPRIAPYLWLIAPGAFLGGAYSALQFWSARQRAFAAMARNRMLQSGSGVATQIALGILGAGPVGLLIGQPVNNLVGVLGLGRRLLLNDKALLVPVSTTEVRTTLGKHNRFVKFAAPELLLNTASVQLPMIVIAGLSAGPEVGFLLLAVRVMQAPLALIGGSVSQVYYAAAADAARDGTLPELTSRVLAQLSKLGIGPLVFAALIAPEAFALVFGAPWRPAGVLVQWLVPGLIAQFLVSPISMSLFAVGRQKASMLLQIAGVVIRLVPVVVAALMGIEELAKVFALTGIVFYGIYLAVVIRAVGVSWKSVAVGLRRAVPVLLAFVCAGLLVKLVLNLLSIAS